MEHWNQNYMQWNKNPGIISFVSHLEEKCQHFFWLILLADVNGNFSEFFG